MGAAIADRLFRAGHEIVVVDRTAEAFGNLPAAFRGRMLEGDVLAQDVLERARLRGAGGVAVATSSDAANAVVGHVAREVFHVEHVVVRNFDPQRRGVEEAFSLEMVSSAEWGAERFEALLTQGAPRSGSGAPGAAGAPPSSTEDALDRPEPRSIGTGASALTPRRERGMNVVVAGGGRTAEHLALTLLGQGHRVAVLEGRSDVLGHLHRSLPTEVIFEGDPTDPDVLQAAGIRHAQVLAAVTGGDAENLVLCAMARRFGVGRTIARVNNPRAAWLFESSLFDVDVAVNQPAILASLIEEEMSMGDMMTLLKLDRGRYSLVEEKIPAGAPAVGSTIAAAGVPPGANIVAIFRRHELVIPRGDTTLEVGDEIVAICVPESAEKLAALLSAPRPT
jgi:trk system potassium uptake protein TrkA